jgi:hypothetical protein
MNTHAQSTTQLHIQIPFADFILQGGRLDGLEDHENEYVTFNSGLKAQEAEVQEAKRHAFITKPLWCSRAQTRLEDLSPSEVYGQSDATLISRE